MRYPAFSILLVDDEQAILDAERTVLLSEGVTNVLCTADSGQVTEIVEKEDIGVILLDLMMPGLHGEELIPLIRLERPEVPIVVVTGMAAVSAAVSCMKAGAADFLVKPVERAVLAACVRRLIELEELRRENLALKRVLISRSLQRPEAFEGIVTAGQDLLPVMQYAEAVAASPRPVLISGETGVGKELFARAIHVLSGRLGDFLAVNIAGLNEELFSDALFGHRRGAFTGAEAAFGGLIEQAAGGTLFFDEIGELSHGSQVKLLRLMESGEFFPLGSTLSKRSTARIVAATNSDLMRGVTDGRFRADLYYRLNTHHIRIPPLRERKADLLLLADRFAGEAAREMGREAPDLSSGVEAAMRAYDFPGNVRQLRAMVFDAMARTRSGVLTPEILGIPAGELPQDGSDIERSFSGFRQLPSMKRLQEMLIDEALRRSGGNQTRAAQALGVTQQAVSAHLKKRRTSGIPSDPL